MSSSTTSAPPVTDASTKRWLNVVLAVGVLDLLLFIVLIWVAFIDRNESAVSVVGATHGVAFVILLGLTASGAVQERWGWWFPAITLVTTGPPGSIIGDFIVRKQIRERAAAAAAGSPVAAARR